VDPPNLHFGVVDFERESVADALGRLPFRAEQPAVFAWLGVTMYLTRPAIKGTWRALRTVAARGSELVFDFIHPQAFSPSASEQGRKILERARAIGEPIITGLDPATLGAALSETGWTLIEQLDPAEIHRRYFAARGRLPDTADGTPRLRRGRLSRSGSRTESRARGARGAQVQDATGRRRRPPGTFPPLATP
jgi:O-methyltransferase involved in polyketide biosynthesis